MRRRSIFRGSTTPSFATSPLMARPSSSRSRAKRVARFSACICEARTARLPSGLATVLRRGCRRTDGGYCRFRATSNRRRSRCCPPAPASRARSRMTASITATPAGCRTDRTFFFRETTSGRRRAFGFKRSTAARRGRSVRKMSLHRRLRPTAVSSWAARPTAGFICIPSPAARRPLFPR